MGVSFTTHIVGSLIFAVLFIPGTFTGDLSETIIPQAGEIVITLVYRLPLLVLLLWMTLRGGSRLRRTRGWRKLEITDVVSVPVLVAVSVGTSTVIPYGVTAIPESGGSVSLIVSMIALSLAMACIEELFFRSWLLSELTGEGRNDWAAVTVSSVGFAVLHHWQGWYGAIHAGSVGVLYSLFFFRRRNIVPLVVSHWLHNTLAILLSAGL